MISKPKTITIEGAYAEECPPVKLCGQNIFQIMNGIKHVYPQLTEKFGTSQWDVEVHTKDSSFLLSPHMFIDNIELGDDIIAVHFIPQLDGGFFLAPFIMAAMAAMGSAAAAAGAAAATTAVAAGGIAAAAGAGGALAIGAGGAIGIGAAIGSAVIVMGAMYGLSQAFQPNVPQIHSQSTASGGNGSDANFLYNNAPNNAEQGDVIPLIYGHMRVGGTVISSALLPYQTQKVKIKS